LCFLFGLILFSNKLFAQTAPNISYSPSTNNYTVGTTISTLAPSNSGGAVSALSGYGTATTLATTNLSGPNGMATDALANVYVCNFSGTYGGTVSEYNSSGTYVGVFISGLGSPTGIVFDSKGNCYVLDESNSTVYKFNSCGGAKAAALSSFVLTGATINYGFAIDASDNLYITNYNGTGSYYVFKYNTTTSTQTTLITTTDLYAPAGAAIDNSGNIFILNGPPLNNLVEFNSSGVLVANNFATGYNNPYGLAVDPGGYIYVGDYGGNHLYVYNKSGTLLATILNSNGIVGPDGLAFDTQGNVFSANYTGGTAGTVTKYAPNGGYFINKKLPAGLFFDGTTGKITGTPTAVSASATYTITAYNASGHSSTSVSISCSLTAPASVSYSSPQSYQVGITIPTLSPSTTGGPVPATTYGTVSTRAAAATGVQNPKGIAVDNFGNVYEADFTGNVIYMINTAGVATIIAGSGAAAELDGSGTAAKFNGPTGIVYDGSNYLYIVDNGGNKIRRMTIACPYSVTTIAGSGTASETNNATGTTATFNKPYGIAYDGTANLYVTDNVGNTIRKVSTTTPFAVTTIAGNGTNAELDNTTGTSAEFKGPAGIAYVTGTGFLYVTDEAGETIRKVGTTGLFPVTTFAGTANSAGSINATGTSAKFSAPYGITVDASGNLIVADEGNNLIRAITSGAVVTTLAGNGTQAELDGVTTAAEFFSPYCVNADQSGNVFVGDNNTANSTIRQILLTGYTVSPTLPGGLSFDSTTGNISGTPGYNLSATAYTITGYNAAGSTSGSVTITITTPPAPAFTYSPSTNSYSTGVAISTLSPVITGGAIPATTFGTVSTLLSGTLNKPRGIASDGAGNIYEADFTGNFIYMINSSGVATKIAGSGTASELDGNGLAATFNGPSGIVYDGSTYLYIVDNGGNKIRRMTIASPYTVLTIAGSGTASETNNATGTTATFNKPYGITYDGSAFLYVTDNVGNTIRKVSTTSTFAVTTIAGNGTNAELDNTTGTSAEFKGPAGIVYVSSTAFLYVTDEAGETIRKVGTTGLFPVTTFAGTANSAGTTNATGLLAKFSAPYGITADATGNLIIADEGNNLIRTITVPGAVVTTLAGSGTNADLDGVTTAAQFSLPYCVTVDKSGNVFVGDNNATTSTLRQIILSGYTISPALPTGLSFDGTTGNISGTPTVVSSLTVYTIYAYNASGSASTTVTITVTLGSPSISYVTPQSYAAGVAITALLPTSSGGTVPATTYSTVSTFVPNTQNITAPRGIVSDGNGNFYEADFTGNAIYLINSSGTATLIAGNATAGETDNATGTTARFNGPSGIVYDGVGFLYVTDNGTAAAGNTIRKISTTSPYAVITIAGANGVPSESDNTTGTSARFNRPYGITYDGSAFLYVTDNGGNTIRKISTTSPFAVTTLASTGLNGPAGIVYDGSANVYVANATGNTILAVTTSGGTVSTFAGSGTSGSANGTGAAATFKTPYGVAFDASGNLIVADEGNALIRIITPAAVVTTLAGSGATGENNAVGVAATFTAPYSICTDNLGSAYVGDNNALNSTVRKIILTGYTISPALPAALSFTVTTGQISGTPTTGTSSPATNYTVTAYNAVGSSSAVVNIAVYQQFNWTGGTSNVMSLPANWNGATTAPGSSDQAFIGVSVAVTTYPVIATGTSFSVGSLTISNKSTVPSITVNGTGVLNVTGDITYANTANTGTSTTATLAGTGTINAVNLNVTASQSGASVVTSTVSSTITNLNLTGNINLTTVNNTTQGNATFNYTGGILTVNAINTTNANVNNISTVTLSPTTALVLPSCTATANTLPRLAEVACVLVLACS